jgi:hypothetical protein
VSVKVGFDAASGAGNVAVPVNPPALGSAKVVAPPAGVNESVVCDVALKGELPPPSAGTEVLPPWHATSPAAAAMPKMVARTERLTSTTSRRSKRMIETAPYR